MSLQVRGVRELTSRLKDLDGKVQRKYVRTSLRAGAALISDQAKKNSPVKTGLMRRAIRVAAGKSRKGYIETLVTIGRKLFKGNAFYGAFQELGHFTGKRIKKQKGPNARAAYEAASVAAGRKFIPGKHFLERAFDSQKSAAVDKARETLGELIEADQ